MSLRQKGLYLTLGLAVVVLATAFAGQARAGTYASRHVFGSKAAPAAVQMQYQHHSGPGGCPFAGDSSDL